jgi:hypothetical protein
VNQDKIQKWQVFHLFCHYALPNPKPKYVVSVEPLLLGFLINSKINAYVATRPKLLACYFLLKVDQHAFLQPVRSPNFSLAVRSPNVSLALSVTRVLNLSHFFHFFSPYRYSDNYLVPFRGLSLSDKRSNERSEITALAVGCQFNTISKLYSMVFYNYFAYD